LKTLLARLAGELLLLLPLLSACASTPEGQRKLPPLEFVGASSFGSSRLAQVVAEEVGEALQSQWTHSAVDDGAFAVERFYASQGFAFATVGYELEADAKGRERARFLVEEGPRVALRSLRFEGLRSLRGERLEGFFPRVGRSGDSLSFEREAQDTGPPWWVESELADACMALEDHLYRSGYLDARVTPPHTSFDAPRRNADVLIEVVEGVRSTLVEVRLEGAPEDEAARLQHSATEFVGRAYSPLLGGALRARLEEQLAERGYPDARAIVGDAERDEDGATRLEVQIRPGERVRIASIEIRGTRRTRAATILELLELEPGDVYSVQDERDSFRALYQSGLFTTVSVGLAPGEGPERVLVVEVEEATASEFYLEPGYGSYERLRIGMGWKLRNLFGTGRSLELDASLAELAQKGSISLVTPRFLGSDVRSTLSVFSSRRIEPSFTNLENGASWILGRRFSRRVTATLGYEFKDTSVSDVDVIGAPAQALVDSVEISSIKFTPVHDARDSFLMPTRGTISRLAFEFADAAIGSELDFTRLSPSLSFYHPAWSGSVLALSWRGGVIIPIHSTSDIPLQERFFNGGENTVRSFREDQLGPTDAQGNPVGGETFQVLSAELRQALRGNLEGALFVDTGNVQLEHADFFSTEDFRSGVGIGLRYRLPIGPIRVDYAVNPDPRDSESRAVLHFTVGMAF